MEDKMRILLDCDGVLADWTEYLLTHLDCGLTLADITSFTVKDIVREQRGDATVKRMNAVLADPEFTLTQPVLPWAKELVSLCHRLGDVVVLTAPWHTPRWYDYRVEWLKKTFGFERGDILVGKQKYWVDADIFIDDKPENVIKWAEANRSGLAVLLAWPYNEVAQLPSTAVRWTPDQLIQHLKALILTLSD